MRIMGIDPGLHITGYGIINTTGNQINLVEAGCIKTDARQAMSQRIETIYKEICEIIEEFHPEILSIENLYSHYQNPKTAIIMGHARGILFLAAAIYHLDLVEYSATRIKKSLSGYGHASKQQMQRMVQSTLNLKEAPEPVDVSDALAAALCHANYNKHYLKTR
jgi:crossover junction endodeoxyribonuclease RuvC